MPRYRLSPVAAGLLFAASLTVGACSSDARTPPPLGPSPPTEPTSRRIRVVDGWTGQPAPRIFVITGGTTTLTDEVGETAVPVGCAAATFTGAGFLERRVRCLSTTVRADAPVTLWPVADELEALETRQFVGSMTISRPEHMPTYLSLDLQTRPGVSEAWQAAAAELRRLTANRWLTLTSATADRPRDSDDYYLIADTADPSGCDHPWYSTRDWLDERGFCLGQAAGYFAITLRVADRRLDAAEVALRTLLYASGAGRHAREGLMNERRPAAALSDFERRTLHMVGLRGHVGWPDDELCPTCQ